MDTRTTEPLSIEVVTRSDRAVAVQFHRLQNAVEVWHRGAPIGWFDRHALSSWLVAGTGVLQGAAVTFSYYGRAVAISLGEVERWPLSPADTTALRELVRP